MFLYYPAIENTPLHAVNLDKYIRLKKEIIDSKSYSSIK